MLRLAVTLGDPRGIGPEVMVEGVRRLQAEQGDTVSFVLLGGGSLAEDLPANAQFQSVGPFDGTEASAGMVSVEALREGVRLCLAGEADALVTGPVSKPALLAAGVDTPGQTEFLGDLTGAHDVGMLMASARARIGDQLPLRILLLTTHLPLREVSDALTEDRLERQLRLLNRALRAGWKIAQPRIALCALNPHASDGGRFGDEEARILEPVVERLRREGDMDVRGWNRHRRRRLRSGCASPCSPARRIRQGGRRMIRFQHVSKSYPRHEGALKDVSFTIPQGAFCFLTGTSGSGKSTTLRLLHMAERPTSGEVEIHGFSSLRTPDRDLWKLRRRVGFVFQDFRLLPGRTALANVSFALEVTGTRPKDIRPRAARLLDQMGLGNRLDAPVDELSGGEQQRVAVARALANEPAVLLADEPTGNLDERASRGILELFRGLNAQGMTIVMATHDLGLVRASPDARVIELAGGELVLDGGEDHVRPS
jgi:cell division transport system ATP-binding protein